MDRRGNVGNVGVFSMARKIWFRQSIYVGHSAFITYRYTIARNGMMRDDVVSAYLKILGSNPEVFSKTGLLFNINDNVSPGSDSG